MKQLGLDILRFILPPFHPWKYKYIDWAWGKQSNLGGWTDWQIPAIEDETTIKAFSSKETSKEMAEFCRKHRVEIIYAGSKEYKCIIDGKVYHTAFTPLYAMHQGIKDYKQNNK